MNSLSWLIYLADVIGSLGGFLQGCIFLSVIAALIGSITWLVGNDQRSDNLIRIGQLAVKRAVACAFVFAIINVATPSRTTIIMIAASELGERVVASPQTHTVIDPSIDLLRTWIEQQTQQIRREMQRSNETRR